MKIYNYSDLPVEIGEYFYGDHNHLMVWYWQVRHDGDA